MLLSLNDAVLFGKIDRRHGAFLNGFFCVFHFIFWYMIGLDPHHVILFIHFKEFGVEGLAEETPNAVISNF